jgi:hypothetical protein
MNKPNKPDSINPAIASRLHAKRYGRGVADPERSSTGDARMKKGKGKATIGTALLVIAAVLYVVVPAIQKLGVSAAVRAGAPAEELMQYMRVALFSMAAGLFIGIPGLVALIVGVVQLRRNRNTQLEHRPA